MEIIDLSTKVKNRLNQYSIITPELFNKIYDEEKNKLDNFQDMPINLVFNKNLIVYEEKISDLSKKTENVQKNTSLALEAIANEDSISLKEIYKNFKNMENTLMNLTKELYKDSLTNSHNRKWLNKIYLENNNFIKNGVITFIDLDDFKQINDNIGHIIGDKVLQTIVKFIQNHFDKLNIELDIIRYGGDEFLIIFDEKDLNEINYNMQKVQKTLFSKKFKTNQNNIEKFFKISFSFGTIPFKKENEFQQIIEKVDKKMYKNKLNKGNRNVEDKSDRTF